MAVNIDHIDPPPAAGGDRRRRLAAWHDLATANRALLQEAADSFELDNISILVEGGSVQLNYQQFVAVPPVFVVLQSFDQVEQDKTATFSVTGSGVASGLDPTDCIMPGFGYPTDCPASSSNPYNFSMGFQGFDPSSQDYSIVLNFWQGPSGQSYTSAVYNVTDPPFSITVAGSVPGGRRLLQVRVLRVLLLHGCAQQYFAAMQVLNVPKHVLQ